MSSSSRRDDVASHPSNNWAGPSRQRAESGKKKKRDRKRVQRAAERDADQFGLGGLNRAFERHALGGAEPDDAEPDYDRTFWMTEDLSGETVFERQWSKQARAMLNDLDSFANGGPVAASRLLDMEERATALILEIDTEMDRSKDIFSTITEMKDASGERFLRTKTLIPSAYADAYYCRTLARYYTISSKSASGLRSVIQDATKALSFGEGLVCAEDRLNMFHIRGLVNRMVGELESSIEDLRAGCAAIRIAGDDWKAWPTIGEMTTALLISLAEKRIREGAERPHYREAELEKLERELGLGIYDAEHYRCSGCGKTTESLSRCGRCRGIWLCSKECQRASWSAGHKISCSSKKAERHEKISIMVDQEKEAFQDSIAKFGTAVINKTSTSRPAVFVKDPVTGLFFDSLTDSDLFFLPSEFVESSEYATLHGLSPPGMH